MKKLLLLTLTMVMGLTTLAQTKHNIHFEEGTFQEALDKATKENKPLFMDCYTAWCGPCKMMAAKVFTDSTVAAYFNANFVSYKMDMEKGEGVALTKRYDILYFPTLLYLDGKGNEIGRLVGGHSAELLMDKSARLLLPENNLNTVAQKYNSGERTTDLVVKYLSMLKDGKKDSMVRVVVNNYFEKLPASELSKENNRAIFKEYVKDVYTSPFSLLFTNADGYREAMGEKLYNEIVGENLLNEIFQYVANSKKYTPEIEAMFNNYYQKSELKGDERANLELYSKFAQLRRDKKYTDILDILEKGVPTFTPQQHLTMAMSLSFMTDGTQEARDRAKKFVYQQAQLQMQRTKSDKLADNISNVLGYVIDRLDNPQ
ncbi:MAG: DUF255 domain-containing protein [Mucinivorans sp.]